MNNSSPALARALCGPLMLITAGALFALDHFGSFSITRTWPVLIIVRGLCSLVERLLLPRAPQATAQGGD